VLLRDEGLVVLLLGRLLDAGVVVGVVVLSGFDDRLGCGRSRCSWKSQ
jgi:hypothetical protein